MSWLIGTLLVGINAAPFIFNKLDVWHAQGIFTQVGILVLFSCSFFLIPRKIYLRNIPLGTMVLWLGLLTGYFCLMGQMKQKYDIQHFFPFFNFLCLVFLYKLVVGYLRASHVFRILDALRYMVIITLFICVLQYFNLGQFFKLLSTHHTHNNIVTGFIGNGTHLSGFLGSCTPLFLIKRTRENYLALVLMLVVMLFTSTTVNDPSISGYVVFILSIGYLLFYLKRKLFFVILACAVPTVIAILVMFHNHHFFSFQGRIGLWEFYWKLFKQLPLTGGGLGTVNMIYRQTPFPSARHLHLEYFQLAFEAGIIGLSCAAYMIYSFFTMKVRYEKAVYLKALVLGFLVSCLFNYPAHLWLPATWAMFFYASVYAIKNEELNYVN